MHIMSAEYLSENEQIHNVLATLGDELLLLNSVIYMFHKQHNKVTTIDINTDTLAMSLDGNLLQLTISSINSPTTKNFQSNLIIRVMWEAHKKRQISSNE